MMLMMCVVAFVVPLVVVGGGCRVYRQLNLKVNLK